MFCKYEASYLYFSLLRMYIISIFTVTHIVKQPVDEKKAN